MVNVWGQVGGVTFVLPFETQLGTAFQLLGMNSTADAAQWKEARYNNATHQLDIPVGSAAIPSYTFAGDLDTGMYQDGANAIGFATGGVRRFSITSVLNTSYADLAMSSKVFHEDISADIAAAATTDLGTATGNYVRITNAAGLTTITSLGGATVPAGTCIETSFVITGGSILLTYNVNKINLPNGTNLVVGDGDKIRWRKTNDASDFWELVGIQRKINNIFVDSRNFGAVLDGITDDTVAIQAAIDSITGPSGAYIYIGGAAISAQLRVIGKSITLFGVGWGSSLAATKNSFLKWIGAAGGVSMLLLQDGFGAGVENLRFIGKSTAKPLAAIEISQAVIPTGTEFGTYLRRVWVGTFYGLDSDFAKQFVNGIIFTGAINGDTNTLHHIRITGCDSAGIDFQNGNASDTVLETVNIQDCGIGLKTKASVTGINCFFGNCTIDVQLEVGGKFNCMDYASEGAGRLCLFNGSSTRLVLTGIGFQAGPNLNADGRFIDTLNFQDTVIDLNNFSLDLNNPPTVPVIRAYNTGGGATTGFTRISGCRGIYPANLDIGPCVGTNDGRTFIYDPAQSTGQDIAMRSSLYLNFDRVEDRTFQAWRNDFAGKINIYGGSVLLRKLLKPAFPSVVALSGAGATTYSYRVTALTWQGETDATVAVTCLNNAVLSPAAVNRLTWFPVLGARAYKIYGRTAGAELLLKTLTYNDLHPGNANPISPPRFDDDGSLAPAGALPVFNTTGAFVGDGVVTGTPFVPVNVPCPGFTTTTNVVIDASLANSFDIPGNTGAAFTILDPINPTTNQIIKITLRNTSGGALGAATFGALYKLAAWVNPANGFSRSIWFEFTASSSIWREVSRTTADVPN